MGRPRNKAEIEKHRRLISERYLKGWLQSDIADDLEINQSTVSRDLKAIQQIWQRETLFNFNEAKNKELARIDVLEREYWQAWVKSCADAEIIKQKGKLSGNDGKQSRPDSVERTVKGRAGDPRFLQGIQWCIAQRCKILGIEAATKNLNLDLSQLSAEQLEQIAKGEDVYYVLANPGGGGA